MGERLIGPVHCLLRCQAQPVGLAEFSKTALFLAGRESKVRRRTLYWDRIWWVLRPSPAHRKTKSSHPSSNLKFIETSGKQTWEKLFPKHPFKFPTLLGENLFSLSKRWMWQEEGRLQRIEVRIGPECTQRHRYYFCSCSTCCAIEVMLRISAQEYSLHNDQWALLCI